ncbi:hypothetical protein C2845_PM08G01330 [Panicum miliaceum]|uniref:Uncharacterized protein n=1 Tax=Panicum miliaceum TaxID=4540 RepID=A0A3L6QXZ5_PANMI|nr:hypothetical protein C2845_PM08G01330 [Panicum miliaceum]
MTRYIQTFGFDSETGAVDRRTSHLSSHAKILLKQTRLARSHLVVPDSGGTGGYGGRHTTTASATSCRRRQLQFFGFLKEGVVVATRNRGLFLPLAALHATRSTAFFLASRTLSFRLFATTVDLEAYDVADDKLLFALLGKFLSGRWCLLHAGVACVVAHVTLGLAIDVATVSAAVASCSGEGHNNTLSSLLGKVRRSNLRGPMVTVAFGRIVGWALVGVVLLVMPAVYLSPGMALLVLLFQFIAFLFTLFYDAVWSAAVVVSVAEPGLRATAVVRRARGLMRGGRRLAQATLYSLVAWALEKAVWRMHSAVTMAHGSSIATALFPLDGVIVYLLLGALKVLCAATVTAYYFDCRRTEEEKAGRPRRMKRP